MAKRKSASLAETRWGMAILHALGVHDWKDPNLIVAIVAWIRAEGGLGSRGAKVFNPLNLHLSPFAHGYAYITTAYGRTPVARFRTMAEAAKAYAWYIKKGQTSEGTAAWRDVLRAMNRAAGTPQQQGERARDVLIAIAEAGWSGRAYYNHYGFIYGQSGGSLFDIASKIGGVTWPKVRVQQKVTTSRTRKIPAPPRQLQPPSQKRNYLDAYEAASFYNGRTHIYAYEQGGLYQPEGID
jgi:hypothetical protein